MRAVPSASDVDGLANVAVGVPAIALAKSALVPPRPPTAPRSSDAMTVPSGRRISIRVMPPGDSRSWSGRWMLAASDEVVAPGSRSLAVSFSLTSARTVAASPPTTASRIDWEYVVETSTA